MKRVVYFSTIQIFPAQTGGHIRAANIIRALAENGIEVRVFALTGRRTDPQARGAGHRRIMPGVTEYVWANSIAKKLQEVTHLFELPGYWEFLYSSCSPLPKELKADIEWCDTLMTNSPFVSPIFKRFPEKLAVANSHNLEYLRFSMKPWQKALFYNNVMMLESRVPQLAEIVLSCSEEERQFFSKSGDAHVIDIPNAVFPQDFSGSDESRRTVRKQLGVADDEMLCLFMGSKYYPNDEAAEFLESFANQNARELTRLGVKIVIVGSVRKQSIDGGPILSTGIVGDVKEYLHAADVALNPMFSGAGTNVKMFEYVAAKLPIVSTEFGARGLELVDKVEYFQMTKENLLEIINELTEKRCTGESHKVAEAALCRNRVTIDMCAVIRERLLSHSMLLAQSNSRSM